MKKEIATPEKMAKAWLVYNGKTGTKKQIDKLLKSLPLSDLEYLLNVRNIKF